MRRRGEKGSLDGSDPRMAGRAREVLAVIDADLQHPPEMVERLWTEVSRGADWRSEAATPRRRSERLERHPPAPSRAARSSSASASCPAWSAVSPIR